MHGPKSSIFSFTGVSVVFPYGPLQVKTRLLCLRLLAKPRRARLAHRWCSLTSILSDSSYFDFLLEAPLCIFLAFLVTLDWFFLGVLQSTFLAYSKLSMARLSKSLLIKETLFSGTSHWPQEPLVTGLLVCTGCFSSPSSLNLLGVLLGLIMALA